jgi:hypothetical protein
MMPFFMKRFLLLMALASLIMASTAQADPKNIRCAEQGASGFETEAELDACIGPEMKGDQNSDACQSEYVVLPGTVVKVIKIVKRQESNDYLVYDPKFKRQEWVDGDSDFVELDGNALKD